MTLAGAILAVLLSFPVAAQDASEPPLARACRLSDLAVGIAEASERATCSGAWAGPPCRRLWPGSAPMLAGELVAIAVGETGLRHDVAAGRCPPDECDAVRLPGGRVHHRARSNFALHRSTLIEWDRIGESSAESSRFAAWGAARVLAGFRTICRRGSEGAHAGYAAGLSCRWSGAVPRARLGAWTAYRIRRLTD